MKKYKGLYVPPIEKEPLKVQHGHCEDAVKCVAECDDCIYHVTNLNEFTKWYKEKTK